MGDDKSDKLHREAIRPALGDISNRQGKRGFSLVSPSPNSPSKSNERAAGLNGGSDDAFWKQVGLLLDKLKNETCGIPNWPNYAPEVDLSPVKGGNKGAAGLNRDPFWEKVASLVKKLKRQRCGSAKCPKVDPEDEVKLSPSKGETIFGPSGNVGSVLENSEIGTPGLSSEVKEASSSALDGVDPGVGQFLLNVVNESDINIQTCSPNLAVAENSGTCERSCLETANACQYEKTRGLSDVLENDSAKRHLAAEDAKDDGKTPCVDHLAYSRTESIDSPRLSEPLDSKSFKLEGCTALKVDDSSSLAADPDLLKSCSCSFCTKAAYIWSDLHYQDVKGRISAAMKSQKEASNLAQRYSGEEAMGTYVLGNFSKATNLEIDLMSQWKSLFLQMESAFVDESSQLQTNFLALKDLRDDFKMNLESINGIPSHVQPCSSDASDHRIV